MIDEPEITKHGCHKAKMAVYKGKFRIHAVQFFIPAHDFSTDYRFAELCAPLDYREIEYCKRYSIGNVNQDEALHDINPKLCANALKTTRCRMTVKPEVQALVAYLKRLTLEYKFTDDLDKDKLMQILEESIHATDPGSQKFNMAIRLLEIRGDIDGSLKRKKKNYNSVENPKDPTNPNKWDVALKELPAEPAHAE